MKHQFRINIKLDFWTIALALALSVIGILFIYSSSSHLMAENTKYLKQVLHLVVALIVYLVVANLNYQRYIAYGYLLYGVGIFLLVVVLIFGVEINNSKSWIRFAGFSFQLSEFAKLFFIVSFAIFLNHYQNIAKKFIFLLMSLIFFIPYLGLLLLQPDIGTAVVFVCIFYVMLFVGGANATYMGIITSVGVIAILLPFINYYFLNVSKNPSTFLTFFDNPLFMGVLGGGFLLFYGITYLVQKYFIFSKKILYFSLAFLTLGLGFLGTTAVKKVFKEYHYKRFMVFINPDLDPADKGYNIRQSLISIGAGQFSGQGLAQGKQNRGNFLPSEDTDFIIALVGEEWGFFGTTLVMLLYLILIYRGLYIAYSAKELTGSFIALGISTLFASHMIINIFSAIGFFPVIGIPLPFLSYGGSSLLVNFIGLGIIFNIKMKRFSYT